jgi:hypothetical protein
MSAPAVSRPVFVIAVVLGVFTTHESVLLSFASFAMLERVLYLFILTFSKLALPIDVLVTLAVISMVIPFAGTIRPPISGGVKASGIHELEHCLGIVLRPCLVSCLERSVVVAVLRPWQFCSHARIIPIMVVVDGRDGLASGRI